MICVKIIYFHMISGMRFHLRASSPIKKEEWVISICHIFKLHFAGPSLQMGTFALIRRRVRWNYIGEIVTKTLSFFLKSSLFTRRFTGDRCQIFVASLISLNFFVNILEAYFNNIDPDSALQHVFDKIDMSFSIIFSVELSINMFSTLITEFLVDGWNW